MKKIHSTKKLHTEQEDVGKSLAVTLLVKLFSIKLSQKSSTDMRANLQAYAEFHTPVIGPAAVLSPYSFEYIFSYVAQRPRVFGGIVAIVLLFTSSFGVADAAEKSLPGEALYNVKVAVIEPIQGTFITNAADKAQWENILINRRLSEATTLAIQDKLATSTQEYLANQVATHVALAQQDAVALDTSGQTTSAAQVRTDLTEKLATNADALSKITPQLQNDTSTGTVVAVAALLRMVNTDIDTVAIASGDATTTTTDIAVSATVASTTPAGTASTTTAVALTPNVSASSTTAVMSTAAVISLPDATSSNATTTRHMLFKSRLHK